jgi:dTDP-4-amino-4,6-dideoxygalactose transaminase
VELGSEFNLDIHALKTVQNSFFKYIENMNYCLFDSGRSALKAITRILGNGYILMPEYICESVLKCFDANRIIFYRLKENLQMDVCDLANKIDGNTAAVYLMHYFGSLQPENALALLREKKEKYGFIIIEDTTHSIFTKKKTVGDWCVASLRKWFAVPNGGVLYADNPFQNSYDEIPRSTDNDKAYAMVLKTLYLSGQLDCNSEYRRIFTACEKKFDAQKEIKRISDFSEFLLGCNDVYGIVKARKSNLNHLKNKLSNTGIEQLCNYSENDCPFAFPAVVPDRDDFRRYLMENKIYCAVHWPIEGRAYQERPMAFFLSNHMISLPIDQRYGEDGIEYLIKVVNAYKGRLVF